MEFSDLKGKRVLVLGLGLHGGGVSVARWLAQKGAHVTVSDVKTRMMLAPSVRALKGLPIIFHLGSQASPTLLRQVDMVVQNPAVPRELPFLKLAQRRGVPIENEASLFLKLCPSRLVLAVSGSKGKSTTTALLGHMLKSFDRRTQVAGNIRDTAMFAALDRLTPATPVVLELSSWHLEVVGAHQQRLPIAILTNVVPEHLNRYRGLADYARAKANIFRYQEPGDTLILNYDNPITRRFGKIAHSRVYWFSVKGPVHRGAFLKNGVAYFRDGRTITRLFLSSDLALPGLHNQANALAAATAAHLVGVPVGKIRTTVRSFRGLHDRLELVRRVRGVDFYNDTTATAPVATQAALKALSERQVVLIAGGADKSLDYRALAADVRRHVRCLVLLSGTATVKLQRVLKGFKPILLARTMPEAVRLASLVAKPGSVVLLSPGAASFGLFKHEFDRGEAFRRAVARV